MVATPAKSSTNFRFGGFEVRSEGDGPRKMLRAEFARYDTWNPVRTMREGHFLEMPERGCMDDAFAKNQHEVRLLFNHGNDIYGKLTFGVFRSFEDEDAPVAYYEMYRGASHVEAVAPGLESDPPTYGLSYRFGVQEAKHETWDYSGTRTDDNPMGLPTRRLHKVDVADVSITTYPADRTTNHGGISMRSLEEAMGIEPQNIRDDGAPEPRPEDALAGSPNARNMDEVMFGLIQRKRLLTR